MPTLNDFLEESQAGLPDAVIAQQTGKTLREVRRWRKAHGIKKPRGLAGSAAGQRYALQLLSTTYETAQHPVGQGPLNWEIPEYVVREPLDYSAFCRLVHACGLTDSAAAAAIGVRELDVRVARLVWRRYLQTEGKLCERCQQIVDPQHRCP